MQAQPSPEIGRTVHANGIATNVLVQGEGPPVLLIHGSGPGVTGYANWRFVIPRLAAGFTAYAPDVVGFGYTERPDNFRYNIDGWVGHMVSLLDALGIEKTHLIGNSFGGAVSLALATRYPDRVDRLVLMGSAGLEFDLTAGLDAVWGYQPSVQAMAALMEVFAYDRALITPDLVEARYRASVRPGYQETFSAMFAPPRQDRIAAIATAEARIGEIVAPTLIVHGRDDRVIPLDVSLRLHQLIARSDLHVFGQCGHWTQVERVVQFCDLVKEFLGREQAA